MKTKTIKVCDAIFVDITCKMNDVEDIKCGGPATLGYEFYVSPDEDKGELKVFLKTCLNKYHREYMSINFYPFKSFPVKNLWTRKMMDNCIKNTAL